MHPLPLTIITLKSGDNIFVTETPEEVVQRINDADARLIAFERWTVTHVEAFFTRPDNVVNVRPNR